MATVQKRNGKYVVIYDFQDANGKRRQKWKSFANKPDATAYKIQIEHEKSTNKFVIPSRQTVRDFMIEWAEMHAKSHWQFNSYTTSLSLMNNHIFPIIGDMELQEVTPKTIEKLYDQLRTKKLSGTKGKGENVPCLSSSTIRHVHTILKSAFDKAVTWRLLAISPVVCDAPKKSKSQRTIWTAAMVKTALDTIDHEQLHLAVHLAFICSLRIGELTGLTWDCIDFENGKITLCKTLQRVTKESLNLIPKDSLILQIPHKMADKKSLLILKTPKTETSTRILYLTQPLVQELQQRKAQVEKERAFMGEDYLNYNLVFALQDGYPIEPKLCEKWFDKWQKCSDLGYPRIIFHEIRHSSATYKLVESNGDHKAVQGDMGHASALMSVDTYSHIQDARRKELMNMIETDFYNAKKPPEQKEVTTDDISNLLVNIQTNPDLQRLLLQALLAQQVQKTQC